MDITNKQVTVESMSVTSFPPKTTASVVVREEIATDIFKVVDTFTLSFERAYQNTGDPSLLAAINDKLASI